MESFVYIIFVKRIISYLLYDYLKHSVLDNVFKCKFIKLKSIYLV